MPDIVFQIWMEPKTDLYWMATPVTDLLLC